MNGARTMARYVLDAREATRYDGKAMGFAVTPFWFQCMFWPPFPLPENGTQRCPPYREVAMIIPVGQMPSPAPGLSRCRASSYHLSPSARPGLCISRRTQPGWENAWEARAACFYVPPWLPSTWWRKLCVPTSRHQSLFRPHTWNWELESISSSGSWFIL